MLEALLVLSPLLVTNLASLWLWLRAEGRVTVAEKERDDLWDTTVIASDERDPSQ